MNTLPIALIGDIGGGELMVVFAAILLLFGGKRLPSIARTIGKTIEDLRKTSHEFKEQLLNADEPVQNTPTLPQREDPTPSGLTQGDPSLLNNIPLHESDSARTASPTESRVPCDGRANRPGEPLSFQQAAEQHNGRANRPGEPLSFQQAAEQQPPANTPAPTPKEPQPHDLAG